MDFGRAEAVKAQFAQDPDLARAVSETFSGGQQPPFWARRRAPGRRAWYTTKINGQYVVYKWMTGRERDRFAAHFPGTTVPRKVVHIAAIRGYIEPPPSFVLPAVLCLIALFLGLLFTPEGLADNKRHEQFATLFGTLAQVIATLFIALALEARSGMVTVRYAFATVGYVAVGLTAALLIGSPSLPGWMYRPLLALGLMGAAGALGSASLIAYWALTRRSGGSTA